MSTLNVTSIKGRSGSIPNFPDGANISGIATIGAGGIDVTGIVTTTGAIVAGEGVNVKSGNVHVGQGGAGSNNGELKIQAGTSTGNDIIAFLNQAGSTRGNITYDTDNNFVLFNVNAGEKLRIGSAGQIGIGGANYGTSGQVLTSQGASTAPQWSSPVGEKGWQLVSSVYLPDLGGTEDNVDFVGLSTAYTAYKVQFTGCTFSHRDTGARNQDKVLGFLRNMSGAWVTNQSYGNRNIRMQGGVVKYDSLESFMAITSNDYCDCISGELIIPMARNNDNSSFGNKLFYGQFITDSHQEIFGCTQSNSDIRSTGFDGIRIQSDDNKWREGRISLYRLPYS